MASRKPVIHGSDHLPGHADPIPGLGGSGIQFDTSPQDGGWLYAETTDGGTAPNGWAIEINDEAALVDNAGIWVHTANGSLLLAGSYAASLGCTANAINLNQSTGMALSTVHYEMSINTDVIQQADASSPIFGHRFTIANSGGQFEVRTSGGTILFRVDSDGDLHGLTGKALTFDL